MQSTKTKQERDLLLRPLTLKEKEELKKGMEESLKKAKPNKNDGTFTEYVG